MEKNGHPFRSSPLSLSLLLSLSLACVSLLSPSYVRYTASYVPRLPQPGETLHGHEFKVSH
jgi:hypothetical protein